MMGMRFKRGYGGIGRRCGLNMSFNLDNKLKAKP